MPFIWDWIWEKLSGIIKTPTQFEGLDQAGMDHQVRQKVVRNRRKVSAKKSNTSAKPSRVRGNNKSKAGGKSAGKTVRATTSKSKTKGKGLPKG